MHQTIGVTGPQRLLLRVLGRAGGMASPGELAETLHVDPSSLTGVLRRLESAKLVKRSVHPVDRRRAIIALTPKGKTLSGQQLGTVEDAVRRVSRTLSASERAIVQRAIASIARELTPGKRRPRQAPGGT